MEFKKVTREWDTLKKDAMERAKNAAPLVKEGKIVDAKDTVALLEAVIKPYDKVNIEGNNQKQADFLAKCLCQVDPAKIHDLHMVQSVLTLPEHLDVFEKGIAKKLVVIFHQHVSANCTIKLLPFFHYYTRALCQPLIIQDTKIFHNGSQYLVTSKVLMQAGIERSRSCSYFRREVCS